MTHEHYAGEIHVANVVGRRVADHRRRRCALTRDRVERNHDGAVEAIGDILGRGGIQLDEHPVGVPYIPDGADKPGVVEPIVRIEIFAAVTPLGLVTKAVADAEGRDSR